MHKVCAIVLAGGKGERMNSSDPKVLHKIAGKPLVFWTLELLGELEISQQIIVTGHKADAVETEIEKAGYKVKFARQNGTLGTANAVKVGLEKIGQGCETVLVLFGDDSSLYKPETIKNFVNYHKNQNSVITLLTVQKESPTPLGGLEEDEEGNIVGVLTLKQMTDRGIQKNKVVCGAFCFNREWLEENLPLIQKSPASGEYPLPGLIKIAAEQNLFAITFELKNPDEWISVNAQEELKLADIIKRRGLSNGN